MKLETKFVIELTPNEVTSLKVLLGYITKEDIYNILIREGWNDDDAMSYLNKTKKDLENLLERTTRWVGKWLNVTRLGEYPQAN